MGETLVALGVAFLAAAVLGRVGRRVGLPTIPLFMLAGVLLGPHTPGIDLVQDAQEFELVATIGLVLLLFYLGLELSISSLAAGGRPLIASGAVRLTVNVGGGLVLGLAFGWGGGEALVVAGAVGISSSAIVTKLLIDLKRLANPETPLILGIIVAEDIFVALYLAALQPLLDDSSGVVDALLSFGRALLFLVVLTSVARWGGRLVGRLLSPSDDELLTVAFVGLALLSAGIADQVGVSNAIGAFMIGLVIAESPVADRVQRLVLPLRDAFAAVFFFTFGLSVDPGEVGDVAAQVMIAVVLTVVLSVTAGAAIGRIQQLTPLAAANAALTLVPRGEFALILVSLAVAAGLDTRLAPFAAGYVLVLAIGGPLLATRPGWLARIYSRVVAPAGPSTSGDSNRSANDDA